MAAADSNRTIKTVIIHVIVRFKIASIVIVQDFNLAPAGEKYKENSAFVKA
jgi:hypothetical protein